MSMGLFNYLLHPTPLPVILSHIHIKNVSFELNACPAFQGNWFEFCMARAWQTFKDMDIKCFFKKCWGINYAGFCIWGVRAHTHVPAHPKQRFAKKAHFAKSFKVCGRLHAQNNVFYLSLSIKQRSYEKISCICYFIGSVVKIVLYLHFRDPKDDRLRQIKKKHE